MQHIVNYSMGVCSAYIAIQWKRDGKEPICVFSDTRREDADTYRFGREVVDRFGLDFHEASDGRDLWDVFREWKMIPARQLAACSVTMKIKPSEAFYRGRADAPGVVAFGYDVSEEDRAEKVMARWQHQNLRPVFPLIEWNVSKQQCFGLLGELGIDPPRVYRHFRNANCLPCKNFRRNDWAALRVHFPEVFAQSRRFEESSGLRWMQDGPTLAELEADEATPKRRRALPMSQPAFSFEMGCDRCAID